MTDKVNETPSSEKSKVTIDSVLKNSKIYSLNEPAPVPKVELIGRIRRLEDKGKFILFPAQGSPWYNYTLEINVSDVKDLELVFKDKADEENYKLSLLYEAEVKVLFQASSFCSPDFQQPAAQTAAAAAGAQQCAQPGKAAAGNEQTPQQQQYQQQQYQQQYPQYQQQLYQQQQQMYRQFQQQPQQNPYGYPYNPYGMK